MDAIKNNPALVVGIVRAIALGLATFGIVTLTNEQEAAIVVVISLVFTFVSSKLTVPKTPTADAAPASIQKPATP